MPLSAAVDLAAIQAYEESLRKGERVTDIRLDVMLFKYLPPRLLQKVASSQRPGVAAAVLRRAKTLEAKRYSLVAAHVAYLEYIAKMPWYGAEHFIVEAVKIYHGIPAKFQLSITPSWVLIVDIESRRILHVLDWTMLRNYGGECEKVSSTLRCSKLFLMTSLMSTFSCRQGTILKVQSKGGGDGRNYVFPHRRRRGCSHLEALGCLQVAQAVRLQIVLIIFKSLLQLYTRS